MYVHRSTGLVFLLVSQTVLLQYAGAQSQARGVKRTFKSRYVRPRFKKAVYNINIPEYPKTSVGTHVFSLKDEVVKKVGKNFRFFLQSNPHDAFEVKKKSGKIIVAKAEILDKEKTDSLVLKAGIRSIHTSYTATTTIIVTLLDVNDNSPVFEKSSYDIRVKNTLAPGSPLSKDLARQSARSVLDKVANRKSQSTERQETIIKAHDRDSGTNGQIKYKIKEVERLDGLTTYTDRGRFVVDAATGSLKLAKTLHDLRRLKKDVKFRVLIEGSDMAEPMEERRTADINVRIRVIEGNDFPPVFSGAAVQEVTIREDSPIGHLVHQIEATDQDGDEDLYQTYSIVGGNSRNWFSINRNGQILLAKRLDRETKRRFFLRIKASDGKHEAFTTVKVLVIDANDNAPVFFQEMYEFRIPEHSPIGTRVGRVKTRDPDLGLGGKVIYSIIGTDYFTIARDGTLSVAKDGFMLDREKNEAIQFTVQAADTGLTPLKSTVEVAVILDDINDQAPTFSRRFYPGSIWEDDANPLNQSVEMEYAMNATDLDFLEKNRDVRYSLAGQDMDYFIIDRQTGVMYVKRPGSVDREKRHQYALKVIARDRKGDKLKAEADVLITVKDMNDNAPVFPGPEVKEIYIKKGLRLGSKIGNVKATDADADEPNNRILYMLENDGYGKFSIDMDTGDIYILSSLAREPYEEYYTLNVVAMDSGKPRLQGRTKVEVHLPLNKSPHFIKASTIMSVREGRPLGTFVGQLRAEDPNEDVLYFAMKEANVPFTIEESTGKVYTTRELDREMVDKYTFTAFVADKGHPPLRTDALITVHLVDINDRPPQILLPYYEGTVVEDDINTKFRQPVIMPVNISADDTDATAAHRNFFYSLEGKHAELFRIHEKTGAIRVSDYGIGRIDREEMETINLTVRATDQGGLSTTSKLIIKVQDENDYIPLFQRRYIRVTLPENVKVGQSVARVVADDKDAAGPNNRVFYYIDNTMQGSFRMDLWSGVLRADEGIFLTPKNDYRMRVVATDLGSPPQFSEMLLRVSLPPGLRSDQPATFLGSNVIKANDNVKAGTVVGKLRLRVERGRSVSSIEILERNIPFFISTKTLEIKATRHLSIRNGDAWFHFTVKATTGIRSPRTYLTQVMVLLVDTRNPSNVEWSRKGERRPRKRWKALS